MLFFLLGLLLLAGVLIALYNFTPVVDHLAEWVVNTAVDHGTEVSFSRLEGNLLGTIRLRDVRIKGNNFDVVCPLIETNYSLPDLLDGNIKIYDLLLQAPEISIRISKDSLSDTSQVMALDTAEIRLDLSSIPELSLRRLVVREGSVQVTDSVAVNHFENLKLEASGVFGEERVNFHFKYLRGEWTEKDILLNDLSFNLNGSRNRVTLNQLEADIDNSRLTAHGEIELQPVFRFLVFADTSRIEIPLIHKFADNLPYRDGFVQFSGDFIGNLKRFNGKIYLNSVLDSIRLKEASFVYRYQNKALTLSDVRINSNFGWLNGNAEISPVGKNKVDLRFSGIDLRKINLATRRTNMEGKIRLNFNTWNLDRITGWGFSRFTNIEYGNLHLDSLFLLLSVKEGNWELKKGSRLVAGPSSVFHVFGTMDREQNLFVQLSTDENNLDTLNARLGLELLGGSGSLEVILGGTVRNPDIFGYFLLDSLRLRDVNSYGVEGRFEIIGLLRERIGYFLLDLSSGRIAGMDVTDGSVGLKINHNLVQIDSIAFYNEDNYISLSGSIVKQAQQIDIHLSRLDFRYHDYRIFNRDTLQAIVRGDSVLIENLVLAATGEGEIEVRGMLVLNGEIGLGVDFTAIRLEPFNQFFQSEYQYTGMLDVFTLITGNLNKPELETEIQLQNFAMNSDTLGNLTAEAAYDDDQMRIDEFRLERAPDSWFSLQGNMYLPSRTAEGGGLVFPQDKNNLLKVEFRNLEIGDLPFFRRVNFPVSGNFSGTVGIQGSAYSPSGNFQITGRGIRYGDYDFPELRLDGRLAPRIIQLDFARINFMDTEILANGYKKIDWNPAQPQTAFDDPDFELAVKIREDSLNFLNVLTPEVDLLTGRINMDARVGGNIQQPVCRSGTIRISDGTLYLSKIENPFTDIEFSADIREGVMNIEKGEGKLAGQVSRRNILQFLLAPFQRFFQPHKRRGLLTIEGQINFAEIQRPIFDLTLNTTDAFINYYLEGAKLLFSAKKIRITGQDTLKIAGSIKIDRAEVDLDLEESEKNLLLSPSVRETPPYLAYSLNLNIPGNFYIRSEAAFNSFEMQLAGELNLIQEPRNLLEIYGDLEVLGGRYVQFEEFDIRRGRVKFVNPKELPEPDIYAEKRKYGYIFELHVGGSLNNPVKEIRILDMNTLEDKTYLYPETKDQIALLLFGVTFNELGGGVMLDKGQEVLNQTIISRIEREARRFIGLDEIRVESKSNRSRRLNQQSDNSSLSLGKYLTPHLYLEYKTQLNSAGLPGLGSIPTPQLSWEAGNQLFLEYRINRNWSISTFYEKLENDRFKIDINWRLNF